ncbi:hypothetical protein [Roseivirga pacifica]|uniref:hypothetical protein n=1 Tax=Roseivirga pacifica TaxID=1267423 RepID=UPI002096360F|nr:hypothetical protein [Roseivirga pacifica]MCO6360308.1 hypothetical protein [Roseivirga pacifica]MCO6375336.1 hypothetical protein [Roseivirga pacifica]MCO6380594.1 hypothetical protein [Roseivirga pacifica]
MMRRILGIVFGIILSFSLQAQGTECLEGDCENGYGVEKNNNSTYYGSFLNGKKHFWGCQVYVTDQIYCGNYSQGLKHLFGTYYFIDGDNDFFMGLYDRNNKLNTGFYIDASAAENGAISMRRDEVSIEPMYSLSKNGEGCVAGNCQNGNGVYVNKYGNIYSGGFFNGEWNGWGCYQVDENEDNKTDWVTCGMYVNGEANLTKYYYRTDKDGFVANSDGVKNVSNYYVGLFDQGFKEGIRTAPIENEEERDRLQYEFYNKPFKSASMSGAEGPYEYQNVCMYGNCKNGELGFSIKSNFTDKEWLGKERIGVYTKNQNNSSINGYSCSYSPAHSNLSDETQNGIENLECGNFINGVPMYFTTIYSRIRSKNSHVFYFGLTRGYDPQLHGILGIKDSYTGWRLQTPKYGDN